MPLRIKDTLEDVNAKVEELKHEFSEMTHKFYVQNKEEMDEQRMKLSLMKR